VYELNPIGSIRSSLTDRRDAPKQSYEGAPDAWLDVKPDLAQALHGLAEGDEVILITWLHQAVRDVLDPRGDREIALSW
jgi:tRNA (Thr-GGU) A37 N-methylase